MWPAAPAGNAWLDVWIRRPGRDTDYRSADDLRKEALADV